MSITNGEAIGALHALKIMTGSVANEALALAIEALEQPKSDPVKHGHWRSFWDEARGKRYGCSECAASEPDVRDFCPNCGARMDGEV